MTETTDASVPQPVPDPHNQFLTGPFAPIEQEITAFDLEVTGELPLELNGRLLRIGPNPIDPEDPTTYNWFTGNGMVHGVRLREGRAEWYRNRFVRDDAVDAGRGQGPLAGQRQLRGGPRWVRNNVVNTNVMDQGGKTWAFAEGGVLPVELSYELESVARSNLSGTLNGAWTGHPHRVPETGELHGIAYYWEWKHASYTVIGTDGRVRKTVDIPLETRPIVHDVAITQRFVVFHDGPVQASESLLAAGHDFPYAWDFTHEPRWALVPLEGSADQVIWCDSPITSVFHILGAFDLPDGRVAVDGVSYERLFVSDMSGPTESPSRLDRFLIDPTTGHTTVQRLDDTPQEMPRLDERLVGHRYRFGYFSARARGKGETLVSTLLKQDLEQGATEAYAYGPGRFGMEAVFVPRTPDSAEDDGWLMTYVADLPNQATEVLVLHAQDVEAGPVARVHIPQRVPLGFHGNWVPDVVLPGTGT